MKVHCILAIWKLPLFPSFKKKLSLCHKGLGCMLKCNYCINCDNRDKVINLDASDALTIYLAHYKVKNIRINVT